METANAIAFKLYVILTRCEQIYTNNILIALIIVSVRRIVRVNKKTQYTHIKITERVSYMIQISSQDSDLIKILIAKKITCYPHKEIFISKFYWI